MLPNVSSGAYDSENQDRKGKSSWIPVEELLPVTNDDDYDKKYFWVKFKHKSGEEVVFPCNYHNGWTNLDTWEDFNNQVTHWMEAKVPDSVC